MMTKRKAKFRVGQVVAVIAVDPPAFETIEGIDTTETGFQYQVQSGYFDEDELRPLTARERGRP